jgi:hypothetical protein
LADPDFHRAFEDAYDSGTDCLEAIARRRAVTESDALLIFLLKTRDPARFNRKQVRVTVGGDPDGVPIGVEAQMGGAVIILPEPSRTGAAAHATTGWLVAIAPHHRRRG